METIDFLTDHLYIPSEQKEEYTCAFVDKQEEEHTCAFVDKQEEEHDCTSPDDIDYIINTSTTKWLNPELRLQYEYKLFSSFQEIYDYKIPKISHNIFVEAPPSTDEIDIMKNNIVLLNSNKNNECKLYEKEKWVHYIWLYSADYSNYSLLSETHGTLLIIQSKDYINNALRDGVGDVNLEKITTYDKINLLRAFVLKEYGGIYFDNDYILKLPIENFLNNYSFVSGLTFNNKEIVAQYKEIDSIEKNLLTLKFLAVNKNSAFIAQYLNTIFKNINESDVCKTNWCNQESKSSFLTGEVTLTQSFVKVARTTQLHSSLDNWIIFDYGVLHGLCNKNTIVPICTPDVIEKEKYLYLNAVGELKDINWLWYNKDFFSFTTKETIFSINSNPILKLSHPIYDYHACYTNTNDSFFSVLSQEGLELFSRDILQQNIGRLGHHNAIKCEGSRIPHNLHYVWGTNPSNPQEIKIEDIEIIKKTVSNLETICSFQKYLWVNDTSLIPESTKLFKMMGFEVSNLRDFTNNFHYSPLVYILYNLVKNDRYGEFGDVARYLVLHYYGGLYLDLDYSINSNVENILATYSFFTGFESTEYNTICGAFLATSQGNSIIESAIIKVNRNYISSATFVLEYMKKNCSTFSEVILKTGPGLLSIVAFKAMLEHESIRKESYLANVGLIYNQCVYHEEWCRGHKLNEGIISLGNQTWGTTWVNKDVNHKT